MVGVTAAFLMLAGCGHTDEEMAAKQREIDKLAADLKAAKAQIADDQAKFSDAQNSIDKMKEQLKQAGLSLDRSQGEAQKLSQALAEYKQRADQLAVIEGRFRELRSKLDKLNQFGVKVVPRNNRLVVQLPGDILSTPARTTSSSRARRSSRRSPRSFATTRTSTTGTSSSPATPTT